MSDSVGFATQGKVWKPRLRIKVGQDGVSDPTAIPGQIIPTALSAKTHKSNWYQADRHTCTFALFADPGFGYEFWASYVTMGIMVEIAFEDVIDFTEVFRGFVDNIAVDAVKGIVTVTGRNCLALLIDDVSFEADLNQTTKALLLAAFAASNLPEPQFSDDFPDVPYGREYEGDKIESARGVQSRLNPAQLMAAILRQVGGNKWEDAGITHFDMGVGEGVFEIIAPVPHYQNGVTTFEASNCTDLKLEHDLSFSQWTHQMVSTTVDANGKYDTAKFPETVDEGKAIKPHYHEHANVSIEDNQKWAQNMHNEFMLHEWIVTATVAGPQILQVKPTIILNVSGAAGNFNGPYQFDSIEHNIDFHKGYKGILRGKWGKTDSGVNAAGAPIAVPGPTASGQGLG